MSSFHKHLEEHHIRIDALVRISSQLEKNTAEGRTLRQLRWRKRRQSPETSYQALGLAKPNSGRGVSVQQIQSAIAQRPLPVRVRSKLVRAVNALLAKRGAPAVDARTLFGDVTKGRPGRGEEI